MARHNSDAEGCLGCLALIALGALGLGGFYVFQHPWLLIPVIGVIVLASAAYNAYAKQKAEQAESKKRLEEWQAEQARLREEREWEEEQRRYKEKIARIEQQKREWYEREVAKIAEVDESIYRLRQMSGAQFESFMADFLRLQGYEVEELAGAGDQGVDLIVTEGEKRIAVQLKQYSRPLGNKPIQEVHTGRFIHRANEAWVITTSSFTKGGIEAAQNTFVRLIDGDELFEWVREVNEELEG